MTAIDSIPVLRLLGLSSNSGTGTVNDLYSDSGISRQTHGVEDDFRDLFRSLMGDMTNEEFGLKSHTSTSSVGKARSGGDIALKHLEQWGKAFGLTGDALESFVLTGEYAKALKDKDLGPIFKRLLTQVDSAEKSEAAIRELIAKLLAIITKPPCRISKDALKVIQAIREALSPSK